MRGFAFGISMVMAGMVAFLGFLKDPAPTVKVYVPEAKTALVTGG